MSDDDILGRLRQVRPAGPPPGLRARVLGAADRRRTWPWALAAAAVLAVAMSLQAAAGRIYQRTGELVVPATGSVSELDALAAALGGEQALLERAEQWTAEQQRLTARPADRERQ
jgi:hypothetical protein